MKREKIESRTVLYRGMYLQLEALNMLFPDGSTGTREVVRVPDAVAVLPVDSTGQVHLVRQYRAPIETHCIEVPAGLLDHDEHVADAAVRECEEETGFRPRSLERLVTYAHAEGYSTGWITLFLGTDLKFTGKTHLDSTEFLEPLTLPFADLIDLVDNRRIVDSKTILCTVLSRDRLNRMGLIR